MRMFALLRAALVSCPFWLASQALAQGPDAAQPKVVREREHGGQIVFAQPRPGDGMIVSVDYQGGILLWDPRSLRQVDSSRRAPFALKTAALMDADTLLVVGSTPNDFVATVDLKGDRPAQVWQKIGGEIQAMSSARPGRKLRAVIGSPAWIRVREIGADGAMRTVFDVAKAGASAATISADGRYVAIATKQKELALFDVDSGREMWSRATDEVMTSLSVGADAGVVLAGYDNVAGFTLKRIDQLDLLRGKTVRSIPLAPCSVLQVEVLDRDRGAAICAASVMDSLVNMNNPITSSIVIWSLANPAVLSRTALPGVVPGRGGYLPFRAGIGLDSSTNTVFAAFADGALAALKFDSKNAATTTERLAVGPVATQTLVVDPRLRRIWSVAEAKTLRAGASAIDRGTRARMAIERAMPGAFSADELKEGLSVGIPGDSWRGNRLTRWDVDIASAQTPFDSDLGDIVDITAGAGSAPVTTMVQVLPAITSLPLESTVLAITALPPNGDPANGRRRFLSIDSTSGLLQEGIRHKETGRNSSLGVCPNAGLPGAVRLSADGKVLVVACLVLKERGSDQYEFLRPEYDLLTYWLADPRGHAPKRVRFKGAPSGIELSRDGRLAIVLTSSSNVVKKETGEIDLNSDYALAAIDIEHGKVAKVFPLSSEPMRGKPIAFAPDGRRAYIASGATVQMYDADRQTLTTVELEAAPGSWSAISSLAIDDAGSLLAVSRFGATTALHRVADGKLAARLAHPGETMTQLCFDAGAAGRLVAASTSGGIALFNYLASERLADFLAGEQGEWLAVTPEGTFSGSIGGELGITVTDGRTAVAVDQLYDVYFQPALLRRRLAGDRSAHPSAAAIGRALAHPAPTVAPERPEIAGNKAQFAVNVRNAGGGIGGMRVFHNGKLVRDLNAAELASASTSRGTGTQLTYRTQLALPIASGTNDYAVTALNADRTSQSRFAKLTVQGPGTPLAPRKAYILAVGRNKFDNPGFPELKLAEKSARALGDTLQALMAGLVGKSNVSYADLTGANSQSDSVERALRELESKAQPDDIVAIVVVTHGKILASGELLAVLGDTRPDGSASLAGARLVDAVNRVPALTQILVLDICHAGAISGKVSENYQERFAVFAGTAGIHIMTSTSAEEPALAEYGGTTVFSHFLLQGLTGAMPGPPATHSLKGIAESVRNDVSKLAEKFKYNQVPSTYSFGKDILLP